VSALNQVATYAAHCASPVVAGSLSPYDVTGRQRSSQRLWAREPSLPKARGRLRKISPYSDAKEAQRQALPQLSLLAGASPLRLTAAH
jgi:hypothetical protein